ncbi:hypothetical protein Gorai_005918 [Gossypium raimondii]|uniref:Uncharacterized protein n=1 Tax=Gossypium raimondii TaxID=29730 RepID=A0A7J8QDV6_GOSRA|nr:hypothetical protein [Gossypium raimondii]
MGDATPINGSNDSNKLISKMRTFIILR